MSSTVKTKRMASVVRDKLTVAAEAELAVEGSRLASVLDRSAEKEIHSRKYSTFNDIDSVRHHYQSKLVAAQSKLVATEAFDDEAEAAVPA